MSTTAVPQGPYLLGIDGGTEAIRAALFDHKGELIGLSRAVYPTAHPHPGWAEGDPNQWWEALATATRSLLESFHIAPEEIAGISYACTSSTVVFCDIEGRPRRPALIWMDVRASSQARQVAATGHPALKYSGFTTASAEWLPCKALWVKQNDPEAFDESTVICEYTDWLGFRLTGRWAASLNTASIRSYYDRAEGGWPHSLFAQLGIGRLSEKVPADVLDMGSTLGNLTPRAAVMLGLRPGLPVAVGGADAFVAMVGLNAIQPGSVALITGNSHLQLLQSDTASYGKGLFGAYTDAVMPGQYTIEGGQPSSGSVLRWLRDLSTYGQAPSDGAKQQAYRQLEIAAASLPRGAEGVQVLEHWQGSRTPHVDSDSRGAIWGLTLAHGAPHLYRAIIEAICFGTQAIFEAQQASGHRIERVIACGGALNSPLWIQTHADVSNRPIAIPRVGEAGTLGAAILASVAGGIYADVATAAREMTAIDGYIEPQEGAQAEYLQYYERYLEAYARLRDLSDSAGRAPSGSPGGRDPAVHQ